MPPQATRGQREDGREHDGVEEAAGQQAVHGHVPALCDGQRDQQHVHQGVERQVDARLDDVEQVAAQEAPHHCAAPVVGQIVGCGGFLQARHFRQTHHAHQQAADGHFGAHIAEDAHRTQLQVVVMPGAGAVVMRVGRDLLRDLLGRRQPDEEHCDGQQDQDARQNQVWLLYGCRLSCLVLGQVSRTHRLLLVRRDDLGAEDEEGSDGGGHGGAQRVEGLHQGQRAGFLARWAQQRHVGVAGHLQQRHTAGQDEEGAQKDGIGLGACGRIEQQAARRGDQKAADHPVLVAQARDELAEGDGGDGVGGEEAELNQQRLRVVQREDFLQVGDQDVVHAGDETHHEEQTGEDGEGLVIVLMRACWWRRSGNGCHGRILGWWAGEGRGSEDPFRMNRIPGCQPSIRRRPDWTGRRQHRSDPGSGPARCRPE